MLVSSGVKHLHVPASCCMLLLHRSKSYIPGSTPRSATSETVMRTWVYPFLHEVSSLGRSG